MWLFSAVLWIHNDFFRIRIQLWIFQVPDPDPGKSSGSMRIRIRIQAILFQYPLFGNKIKTPLNSIKKKNLPCICQSYSTHSPEFTEIWLFIYQLFIFSLIRIRNYCIIPDPDPGKSFGSMRIRIQNKESNSGIGHCSSVSGVYNTEESRV